MTNKCLICGYQLPLNRAKLDRDKTIVCQECGEVYVYGTKAEREFYATNNLMYEFRKQGIPRINYHGAYFYPKGLCTRWFAGEEIESEAV